MKHEDWERLKSEGDFPPDSRRLKVFGGWVFNTWSVNSDRDIVSESSCFIPDPTHAWKIIEDKS